jgi:hypothetical protein
VPPDDEDLDGETLKAVKMGPIPGSDNGDFGDAWRIKW